MFYESTRITRAQVSDSATYTCIASNRAGVDNRHYNLQVHGESEYTTFEERITRNYVKAPTSAKRNNEPNTFSVPPGLDGAGSTEDVTVVRGNLASLLCVADGTPTPTVSWLKEGEPLYPDRHLRFKNLNTTVEMIQAEVNDTGSYTCVANNTVGQASRHFNLKVLGEWQEIMALILSSLKIFICR